MAKYHYEYLTRCDNLCYGGLKIGQYKTKEEAYDAGRWANKGCFVVNKIRVYN